jgi:diguanylate cyclase (GGDEF)-like protein
MADPKFRFINWPLQAKVMFWVVLTQMLLSAVVFFAIVHRSDNALRLHTQTALNELNAVMSTVLIDPLFQSDLAALDRFANELIVNKAIEGILITGPAGQIYAKSGTMTDSALLETQKQVDWDKTHSVKQINKIVFAGQNLGTVHYSVSLEPQLRARTELINQFLLIAGLMTGFSIFLGYLFSARLVARIKAIRMVSDSAADGDFTKRLKVSSSDELGALAHGFNVLSESVNVRIAELFHSKNLQSGYLFETETAQARLLALLNSMKLGIALLDKQQNIIYQNDALKNIWSEGMPTELTHWYDQEPSEVLLDDGRIILQTCQEVFANAKAGNQADMAGLNLIGSLWIFEDVTVERNAQRTIQYLAERDSLTGLYNRRSFNLALQEKLKKNPQQSMALVYVDLDNFKLVNDLKGHAQGDKVLVDIAHRLTEATRSSDLVARIGGDEFVLLVSDIEVADQVSWCDRLITRLSVLDANSVGVGVVSCSAGVAWFPRDGSDAQTLMAAADEAMYEAKRSGKNAWRVFSKNSDRHEEKLKAVLWNQRIDHALSSNGFEIFLQGIHCAISKEIRHFEALIRMPNPEQVGKYFNPGEFINHAEESGKILQLDRWMISHTIQLLAKHPPLPSIAVNLSAISMSEPSLPDYVQAQLNQHGVPGHRLYLELTETAAVADIRVTQAASNSLHALGCQVCLDDFGSGFTSLAYLKSISARYLKLDGVFIRDLATNRENQVLLRAIVDIARLSDRVTVAEWVEDQAMLAMLNEYGVNMVQGFYLSKPMPAHTVITAWDQRVQTELVALV